MLIRFKNKGFRLINIKIFFLIRHKILCSFFQKVKCSFSHFGIIKQLADGIANVQGLDDRVMFGEITYFKGLKTLSGMIMSLSRKSVYIVLFFNIRNVKEGDYVIPSGKLLELVIDTNFFGHVITTLGSFLTRGGRGYCDGMFRRFIDSKAAGISQRDTVYEPMLTGQLIIDSITPIGLGQRELIVGDRQTGKTTAA